MGFGRSQGEAGEDREEGGREGTGEGAMSGDTRSGRGEVFA